MSAIVTELLAGLAPVWTWITTNFVPASASAVTIIHFAMWSSLLLSLIGGMMAFVMRRGRR